MLKRSLGGALLLPGCCCCSIRKTCGCIFSSTCISINGKQNILTIFGSAKTKLPQLLLQWRILQVPIAHPTTFVASSLPPKQSKANAGPPNIPYPSPAVLYVCTHTAITPDSLACRLQEHAQQQQPSFEPPLGNKHIQGVVRDDYLREGKSILNMVL